MATSLDGFQSISIAIRIKLILHPHPVSFSCSEATGIDQTWRGMFEMSWDGDKIEKKVEEIAHSPLLSEAKLW